MAAVLVQAEQLGFAMAGQTLLTKLDFAIRLGLRLFPGKATDADP